MTFRRRSLKETNVAKILKEAQSAHWLYPVKFKLLGKGLRYLGMATNLFMWLAPSELTSDFCREATVFNEHGQQQSLARSIQK